MITRFERSIRAALQNGRRLLDDADFLRFNDSPATAYFLCLVAQEEFAKAFLLALVNRGVVPWDQQILRATKDHKCKQLLCMVMEYVNPDLDEFIDRCNAVVLRREVPEFPPKVADAINILRHEKIGRWVSQSWVWADDSEYDRDALAIAAGKQDRQKQDALYLRLAADGGPTATPTPFTGETVRVEMERAERFLDGQPHPGLDYDKVEEAFRLLFTPAAASAGSVRPGR